MIPKVINWLLDRASLSRESLDGLNKGLPKGVGWPNTLGSVAFTLIVFQFVTGAVLAMFYTPSLQGAYESMTYVDKELFAGKLLHGLHHYGAGAAVVVVALHMLRTFFYAAYKPPRELLWLMGVILLQLVIGFGFTGYLLPWDQKAYWATKVGAEIAGTVPVLGPYIANLLRGGEAIGQATLTRFYSIHVLILPALVFTIAAAHMLLVWRKGATPPGKPVDAPEEPPATRFVDHQLFKDTMAIFIAVGIVFALAMFRGVHMEFKADPSDPFYEPRPEWYLLSIFEFLHIMGEKAPWLPEVIPAVVLPGMAFTWLALLPWLDRNKERHPLKRKAVVIPMFAGIIGIVVLTLMAYARAPKNSTPPTSLWGVVTHEGENPPSVQEIAAGKQIFITRCGFCHTAFGEGSGSAPDLSLQGVRRRHEYFMEHVRDPLSHEPASTMPAFPESDLSQQDLDGIAGFLGRLPGEVSEEDDADDESEESLDDQEETADYGEDEITFE